MVANPEFALLCEEQPSVPEGLHNTLPVPFIEAVDVSERDRLPVRRCRQVRQRDHHAGGRRRDGLLTS